MNTCSNATSQIAKTALIARRVLRTINASGGESAETSPEPAKYSQFAALVGDARTGNYYSPGLVSFGTGYYMLDPMGSGYTSAGLGIIWCGPDSWLQTSPSIQHGLVDEWLQLCLGGYWGNTATPAPVTGFGVEYASGTAHPVGNSAPSDSTHRAMLEAAALRAFPRATFVQSDETDPDEGWTRPVLFVHTDIENIDDRMAKEETFYADITAHETTTEALKAITVVFE